MKETRILEISMQDKNADSIMIRQILSQSDKNVRTNEGLVEATKNQSGYMMIRLNGDPQEIDKIEYKIKSIKGASVDRLSL